MFYFLPLITVNIIMILWKEYTVTLRPSINSCEIMYYIFLQNTKKQYLRSITVSNCHIESSACFCPLVPFLWFIFKFLCKPLLKWLVYRITPTYNIFRLIIFILNIIYVSPQFTLICICVLTSSKVIVCTWRTPYKALMDWQCFAVCDQSLPFSTAKSVL